jgi:hypothetical protein
VLLVARRWSQTADTPRSADARCREMSAVAVPRSVGSSVTLPRRLGGVEVHDCHWMKAGVVDAGSAAVQFDAGGGPLRRRGYGQPTAPDTTHVQDGHDEPMQTMKPTHTMKPMHTMKPRHTMKPLHTMKPMHPMKPTHTMKGVLR